MKPNKSRLGQWVAMLRSGKYTQGDGALRRYISNKYCCLGVACDLYRKEVGGKWFNDTFYPISSESDDSVMPETVAEWFGIDRDPVIQLPNIKDNASILNDDGASFADIADGIEKTFKL